MTLVLDRISRVVGGETHLHELSLTLEPGSLNVLFGPTLAGKTSLMRLMAGLDRPSAGRVLWDGKDVTGVSVRRRQVAMVYQQFVNYPSFTVYDNIASPLKLAGLPKAEIDRKVREAAGIMHIDGLLKRLPAELSGGQQQRTAIARALVKEAGLLLLDEPLVNLDYKLREELRSEMREIFKRHRSIVVYATTEPLEALMLGGTITVLHEGKVLQSGPTVQVYHNPSSLRVGQVFSDPPLNQVDGVVDASGCCWPTLSGSPLPAIWPTWPMTATASVSGRTTCRCSAPMTTISRCRAPWNWRRSAGRRPSSMSMVQASRGSSNRTASIR